MKNILGDAIAYSDNQYDCLIGADALVILPNGVNFGLCPILEESFLQ
ncbi:MAG: hypothetical protein M9959_14085 [Chitinophagaceae bacterium]|nr:hypothetical protein [Chitinophagaceae bacterium]